MLLKVIILFISIIILFHYKKYISTADNYEIHQQELDYTDGNKLYDSKHPLVITYIEDNTLKYNIENYKLFTDISINLKYFNLITNNNYLQHKNEILLIRCKKDIKLEIINSKYIPYFNKLTFKNNLKNYKLNPKNYENVQSIEISLHEENIIYIPRFSLFKFSDIDISVEIFMCDSIFTYLFKNI